VVLHAVADRAGLTAALGPLWPGGGSPTWRDRAHVLLGLTSAIVLGATNLSEAEQLQAHHGGGGASCSRRRPGQPPIRSPR
jgi:hypothetical protein